MNEYTPDRWIVLKFEFPNSEKPFYKVLGGWHGSYVNGQSWRLNSGITNVELIDDSFCFHGYSGSVYVCHKDAYSTNIVMSETLSALQKAAAKEKINISVMPSETDWLGLQYV